MVMGLDLKAAAEERVSPSAGRTVEEVRAGDWIQTAGGRRFWPCDPRAGEVFINDIAHALGNMCRFTGHVRRFYSVAQHSVLVSYVCDPADALWGLLHDGSEAYLNDIARPVKRSPGFADYRRLEGKVQRAVCERFGLAPEMPASVHKADQVLLYTEFRDLMHRLDSMDGWDFGQRSAEPLPLPIEAWAPAESCWRFLSRYAELTGGAA